MLLYLVVDVVLVVVCGGGSSGGDLVMVVALPAVFDGHLLLLAVLGCASSCPMKGPHCAEILDLIISFPVAFRPPVFFRTTA